MLSHDILNLACSFAALGAGSGEDKVILTTGQFARLALALGDAADRVAQMEAGIVPANLRRYQFPQPAGDNVVPFPASRPWGGNPPGGGAGGNPPGGAA